MKSLRARLSAFLLAAALLAAGVKIGRASCRERV